MRYMTLDHLRRRLRSDEGGAVIVLVAISLVVIVGFAGIAIDLGRGYLEKARLSRAVDAGVLAGARSLRSGNTESERQALELARANGLTDDLPTDINVTFGTTPEGENTVTMAAHRRVPTTFMRVFGREEMNVESEATAAVPPVDMLLVLDQSGSLRQAGAWGDLQDAAKTFVGFFDDNMDQMGLVSFQIRGTDRFTIDDGFTNQIENAIDGMSSDGDTNTAEGLRLALEQMQLPGVRDRSAKVVVFFTDGRPTAFRGILGPGGPSEGGSPLGPFTYSGPNPNIEDRAMAVYVSTTGDVRGYFNDPETLPTDQVANPDGCAGWNSCWGWHEDDVRDAARDKGLEVADAIREEGIFIYTIALGNPGASNPMLQPDLAYLEELANVNGATDGSQPAGGSYFAPSASELEQVFSQVAQDLLVRLAQ